MTRRSLWTVNTAPLPCEWCSKCDSSLAEIDGHRHPLAEDGKLESEKEIREQLADLAAERAANAEDPEQKEDLQQRTAFWRGRLAAVLSQKSAAINFIGKAKVAKDDGGKHREFGLGDNFHETVLPKRTHEEHRAVRRVSEALVHLVSHELAASKR